MCREIKDIIQEQQKIVERTERLLRCFKSNVLDAKHNARNSSSSSELADLLVEISQYNTEYMQNMVDLEDTICGLQSQILTLLKVV